MYLSNLRVSVSRISDSFLFNKESTLNSCLYLSDRDLDVLFLVLQLFSYPGDYVQECPTVERIGETVVKLAQDLGGGRYIKPAGARRLTFSVGEPIDMRDHLGGKFRDAVPGVTRLLAQRLQDGLDQMGPGTHVDNLNLNHQNA